MPKLITLKAVAIGVAAAALIGLALGIWIATQFWAPRLELAQEKVQTLGASIQRQNDAIDDLKAAAKERAAQAEKALQAAQAGRDAAEARASDLLKRRPKPGENRCEAASAIIREELGK